MRSYNPSCGRRTSKMVYIEPIQLEINTAGEQLSPTLEGKGSVEVPEWSETYNWALNKILSDDCNSITQDDILESIDDALEDLYDPINNVEEEFAEFLKQRANRAHPRQRSNVVLYEANAVILPTEQQGQLYAVSEYEGDVKSIVSSFEDRMSDFSNVASDFGLDVDIVSGSDFAESMSENIDAEIVSRDDFDNTAEESVHSEITERLTKSVDSNITLRFGDSDPETFEYDLLLHAGQNNRVVIEVKDASREEADLNKNDLIDVPRDKTNIIKSEKR